MKYMVRTRHKTIQRKDTTQQTLFASKSGAEQLCVAYNNTYKIQLLELML